MLGYQDGQTNNTSGFAEDAAWAMTLVNTTATQYLDARTEAAFWYTSNGANCTPTILTTVEKAWCRC
jgi:hypothetical protein